MVQLYLGDLGTPIQGFILIIFLRPSFLNLTNPLDSKISNVPSSCEALPSLLLTSCHNRWWDIAVSPLNFSLILLRTYLAFSKSLSKLMQPKEALA